MKISIITINLNNCNGLERTIKSVIIQDSKNLEFIVIDGGSRDGSKELLEKFNNQIDYWKSEPDNGIYHAMNKGISNASGDYCLFVNSGDILYNKKVINDLIESHLYADIITGNTFVGINGRNLQLVKSTERISFYTFYQHTILHQASLIRTSLFREFGNYNECLRIVADWEFFIKALFIHHCSYQSINITISVFENNGISSDSKNFSVSLNEREEILQKYFPFFLADYRLLQPHSTYVFLKNIQEVKILRYVFELLSRLVNRFFKLLR